MTHPSPREQGTALVIVLSFLVIITVLIVAFYTSVSTELVSTKLNAAGITARQLSDSAVQLVISQIRDATTQQDSTWAAQPGMIRTYDNTGAARSAHKLFSDSSLVHTGGNYDPETDWAPTNWALQPGLFVDLNAPVASAGGLVYPIVDPSAAELVSGKSRVDGFEIDATADPLQSSTNPAAMPVEWLYVLKDGTIASATPSGAAVQVVGAGSLLADGTTNDIVGRIAFWTDDETCKLNLNTATEGVPWFPPSSQTVQDVAFSTYQPAQNEFNRILGHPASTSLSPVLWSYFDFPTPNASVWPLPAASGGLALSDAAANAIDPTLRPYADNYLQALFGTSTLPGMAPRSITADSGSKQGTDLTAGATKNLQSLRPTLNQSRLYASMDEFGFAPPGSAAAERPLNNANLPPSELAKLRFFLTAQSNAPEVNLFQRPRLALWPVPDSARTNPVNNAMTPSVKDKLIAFCSTLNQEPYYYTRFDPQSPTNDFTQIPRNQELYAYLRSMMSQDIPGYGSSFQSRFGSGGCDQLNTMLFDYIRGTINLVDSGSGTPGVFDSTWFRSSYTVPPAFPTPATANSPVRLTPGVGQVVPISIGDTKGMGRFPVVKSATIVFTAVAADQPPLPVNATREPTSAALLNSLHPFRATNNTSPWRYPLDAYPVVSITSASGTKTTFTSPATAPLPLNTVKGETHPGLKYLPLPNPNPSGTHQTALDAAGNLTGPLNNVQGAFDLPNQNYRWSDTSLAGLAPHQTKIQAFLILEYVNPVAGVAPLSYDFQVQVQGLDTFTADGTSLSLPDNAYQAVRFNGHINSIYGADPTSYNLDWSVPLMEETAGAGTPYNKQGGQTGLGAANGYPYPFASGAGKAAIPLTGTGAIVGTGDNGAFFDFSGGPLTIKLYGPGQNPPLVQTINLNFPRITRCPTPKLPVMAVGSKPVVATGTFAALVNGIPTDTPAKTAGLADLRNQMNDVNNRIKFSRLANKNFAIAGEDPKSGRVLFTSMLTADTLRSVELIYGDARGVATLSTVPTSFYREHRHYGDATGYATPVYPATAPYPTEWSYPIRAAHSIRGSRGGANDYVLGATLQGLYDQTADPTATPEYYLARGADKIAAPGGGRLYLGTSLNMFNDNAGGVAGTYPNVTSGVNFSDAAFRSIWEMGGDYDTGTGNNADGPYVNKTDEGQVLSTGGNLPYFNTTFASNTTTDYQPLGSSLFSPARQVHSPLVFGSLPVPLDPTNPSPDSAWRTLLFCPNPNSPTHASLTGTPPDYLLLDFFHMPVVEPYAISTPMATSGKVNMNYQIAPFSYITRDTALRGVMKSVLLTALEDRFINAYKGQRMSLSFSDTTSGYDAFGAASGYFYGHYPVHAGETLKQFEFRFSNTKDLFRSPAEICSLWLYPARQPTTAAPENPESPLVTWDAQNANIRDWWYANPRGTRKSLTGDNLRERPYSALYPRLTTQSNTFTVHCRVQSLKKVPGTVKSQWVEGRDQVIGEYRGATLIERYIDPGDSSLPDFATDANAKVTDFYKFRVVSTKKFSPE